MVWLDECTDAFVAVSISALVSALKEGKGSSKRESSCVPITSLSRRQILLPREHIKKRGEIGKNGHVLLDIHALCHNS